MARMMARTHQWPAGIDQGSGEEAGLGVAAVTVLTSTFSLCVCRALIAIRCASYIESESEGQGE